MDTNIKNRKEHDILYLMEYFYEEAFMLDRDVMGEAKEYIEFLNYAYGELDKQGKVKEYIKILKPFIYDTIVNSENLSATLLYMSFNTTFKQNDNEEKTKILSRFNFKKVV